MPFTARPGGVPANVAAVRLGQERRLSGASGRTSSTASSRALSTRKGVDISCVRGCEPPTRTSVAFVKIDGDGDRSFTFYRSDPDADELLDPEDVAEGLVSGASFVNVGSIPLPIEPARLAIQKPTKLARESGGLRRQLPGAPLAEYREAREVVSPLFDEAYVVKLSGDELPPLLGTKSAEEAARKLLEK